MVKKFCHICGTKLSEKSDHVWHCSGCDSDIYANPKPCVDIALFNSKDEVLVTTRAGEPYKGKLDLPGGFVDMGETLEESLLRELKEELGLDSGTFDRPIYVNSRLVEYPYGKDLYSNLVMLFTARIKDDKQNIKVADDVADAKFVNIDTLSADDIPMLDSVDTLHRAIELIR